MSAAATIAMPKVLPQAGQDPAENNVVIRHEEVLIRRILDRDVEAFTELVSPYRHILFHAALSVLDHHQEDAEDCVQEALLKALRHLKSFRGDAKFSTWLTQIVINEALMRRRQYRRALHDSIDEPCTDVNGDETPVELPDHRESPLHALERNLLRQAIYRAIAALAPIYRDVFELRDVQEYSIAETARHLGVTEATVKTRLLRARNQLKRALAPAWGGCWQRCLRAAEVPQLM